MARKKKSEGDAGIFIIPGLLLFLPFLTISFLTYGKIKNQYMQGDNHRRIVDTPNLWTPVYICGGFVGFTAFMILQLWSNSQVFALLLFCAAFFIAVKLAKWLAVKYVGAVIDPDADLVVFPPDMQSYGLFEYVTFRFLTDLSRMDAVKISEIEKMTRQAGKHLFLEGPFGSRKISFSDKQKRDECMSAIQHFASKGVLMYELEHA